MYNGRKLLKILKVQPVSMVDRNGQQRVNFKYFAKHDVHCILKVYHGNQVKSAIKIGLLSGENSIYFMIPKAKKDFSAKLIVTDTCGEKLAEKTFEWKKPLEREIYIMVSSHTDIGLHNSQYIQRYNSEKFLDEAVKLVDQTENEAAEDRYRYTIEGTWFWNNYPADRGVKAAKKIAENYIKQGKIGICGGVAGNHTHVYGAEELCRSLYPRKALEDTWGIATDTISMIDNNGLCQSMVQPYAEAGVKNIFFSPNQWNPIPSSVWNCDKDVPGYTWNSEAGGGGARVEVRYSSDLPMLFWWKNAQGGQKLLVWASLQYDNGSKIFGFNHRYECSEETLRRMEKSFSERLPRIDKKYPYRVWLMADYGDDQFPDLKLQETIKEWNQRWAYPKLKISGNISEPFEIIRNEYAEKIPVLKGDITGGWYQHPLATAELTARKMNADRRLAAAEKACVIAALSTENFAYPKEKFDRAWNELLMNDEHSYGASGYVGRRVFETWLQHRVWVENAEKIAAAALSEAFEAQCVKNEEYITFFNPSANERNAVIRFEGKKYKTGKLPPLKLVSVKKKDCIIKDSIFKHINAAPVIESAFYLVKFAENGAVSSIYDKNLNCELLAEDKEFGANEFVYTKDNHRSYSVVDTARFTFSENEEYIEVTAHGEEKQSGASLEFTIKLFKNEKKIEFDDRIYHAKDMFNNDRWKRYAYIAFPIAVPNAKRIIFHNGVKSEYAKDVTGHGTDVYAACNEWCCVENGEYGAGLVMRDSQIIEFDHIHRDKTDFGNAGNGSAMYVYVANDWLQRHVSGGSYIDFRFRFMLTTYAGNHKRAKLDRQAENFVNDIEAYGGKIKEGLAQISGLSLKNSRLVGMKLAENGKGIIVRTCGKLNGKVLFNGKQGVRVAIDESKISHLPVSDSGLATWFFETPKICVQKAASAGKEKGKPGKIGARYTGLIDEPKATCGEYRGHLYLLWGKNAEKDLDHYELYRGETENFTPDEYTFVENVLPEVYCEARYEDRGLKDDAVYYYTVRAVNKKGVKGDFSSVFSGRTRELIDGKEQNLSDLSGAATSESKE